MIPGFKPKIQESKNSRIEKTNSRIRGKMEKNFRESVLFKKKSNSTKIKLFKGEKGKFISTTRTISSINTHLLFYKDV